MTVKELLEETFPIVEKRLDEVTDRLATATGSEARDASERFNELVSFRDEILQFGDARATRFPEECPNTYATAQLSDEETALVFHKFVELAAA